VSDELVSAATKLMIEQAADYDRLEVACSKLSDALITSEPAAIDSLTRAGEVELLRMRSRLVRIIQSLTAFAEARAAAPQVPKLSPEVRSAFESASKEMLEAAKKFQRTRETAVALTTSGSTFAAACIEFCGIQPTTYNGPYSRSGETRPWG
jgi:ATP-dependent Clp protease ATP-binding subunit ClpA